MTKISISRQSSADHLLTCFSSYITNINGLFELGKASISYMGHIQTSEGYFPESEKVDSILNMKPLSSTNEVFSFLCFIMEL